MLPGAVPSEVTPSKNWTVPVAVFGVTVAVNVTGCWQTEGLGETASTVLVACVVETNDAAIVWLACTFENV